MSRHDDAVDAFAYAMHVLKQPKPLTFWQRLSQRLARIFRKLTERVKNALKSNSGGSNNE